MNIFERITRLREILIKLDHLLSGEMKKERGDDWEEYEEVLFYCLTIKKIENLIQILLSEWSVIEERRSLSFYDWLINYLKDNNGIDEMYTEQILDLKEWLNNTNSNLHAMSNYYQEWHDVAVIDNKVNFDIDALIYLFSKYHRSIMPEHP